MIIIFSISLLWYLLNLDFIIYFFGLDTQSEGSADNNSLYNSPMNLLQVLTPPYSIRVAIVGAGGKTTAMFSLARQLDGPAWVTTTTHLGTDQPAFADRHFVLQSAADVRPDLWLQQKVTLLTGPKTKEDRLRSPAPELMEMIQLSAGREGVSLLLEGDGSRSIPLKAPGEHEPVIPEWVTCVLVVVGMSALGKPLSEQTVFRAGGYSELTGLREGEMITIESLKEMLLHPLGGLKNIPPSAMKAVLFNQADSEADLSLARSVAADLLLGGFDRVIAGGLKTHPDQIMVFD